MKNQQYLQEKVQGFIETLEPTTRAIVNQVIGVVEQRNLSVETLSKKVDRQIDRMLKDAKRGEHNE
ncbi:hypothetical protein [Priestia flexa]|jgi:uncharacterized protein YoxC|uniref:hypothetical protein n=1 Tax=Priestia flexa TaxID=86664 RepID=UPI002E206AA9|nr:hypothetical protein [Priestia flexa]